MAVQHYQGFDSRLYHLLHFTVVMRYGTQDCFYGLVGIQHIAYPLERLLAWPQTNLGTDGQLDGKHPRGFGSYPRVLGRYVRERHVLDLATAIRKATALAADHIGLTDRGRLVPGAYADLVLFDPATIADRATTDDPHALADGLERVWVNGAVVFEAGKSTGERPGKVLRRRER